MSSFLLDANLSPKIARFLQETFQLDVLSLLDMGLGEMPDREVLRLVKESGRVLITLDSDFTRFPNSLGDVRIGVVHLRLPNSHRYVPEIKEVLRQFFRTTASSIDLEHSTVVITERLVLVTRHPS